MDLKEFDYQLPESLIAAFPSRERTGSRLLVIRRATGEIVHSVFAELGRFLDPGDLLVLNDTKVFPARLRGTKDSGGKVEVLLIERFPDEGRSLWIAMADATKKPQVGSLLRFSATMTAEVIGDLGRGRFGLEFHHEGDFDNQLDELGEPPLPPYVRRSRDSESLDRERYQTVYAANRGAVAAPTAGFHFTPELLAGLGAQGIDHTLLTLHVGPGTFQPVRVAEIENHRMEGERYSLSAASAEKINRTKHDRSKSCRRRLHQHAHVGVDRVAEGRGGRRRGHRQAVPAPRRQVPRARRPNHQLSSARLDATDTRRRICRPRTGASGLSRGD